MLVSRGVQALRAIKSLSNNRAQLRQAVRNHGDMSWSYRVAPAQPSKQLFTIAEIVQGTAWWWIMWHLWTEPDHVFGEFEYPDTRKWTDEELGIPEELEIEE